MKVADAGGMRETFGVDAWYREAVSKLGRDALIYALIEEAELRGAWQSLAFRLADRAVAPPVADPAD